MSHIVFPLTLPALHCMHCTGEFPVWQLISLFCLSRRCLSVSGRALHFAVDDNVMMRYPFNTT